MRCETAHATLSFTQTSSTEDLDLYIYHDGVNLTGCSEATPASCDANNGASSHSNEALTWPISVTGTYYLVVHGWSDSENSYDLCIGLQGSDCP